MKCLKSEKGEFTVEATIVFTVTFMAIILMLYIGIVMYQHVHLQSATDRVASRGAMMYATRTTDIETGYKAPEAFWDSDPYRYIYDKGYKTEAEAAISAELKKSLGTGNVVAFSGGEPTAKVELGLLTRKVVVKGERKFSVPFLSFFDLSNSLFDIEVNSTAYIMDMPETIRNVDYVCDMLKQNESVNKALETVGGLKEKLEKFINQINTK